MKPIDAVRSQLDYDFQKYSNFLICRILKVLKIKGIGMVLQAIPEGKDDSFLKEDGEETVFNVVCVNAPYWWEWNIKEKYNVMIISTSKDRPAVSPGLLIPKTMIESFDDWTEDDKKRLFSERREYILMKGIL